MTDKKINSDWMPLLITGATAAGFTASYKYLTGLENTGYPHAGASAMMASASVMIAAQYDDW